ncbi:MAG: Tfp pilus assembly protein FimT/FimU [Planctomycetota bacterium]
MTNLRPGCRQAGITILELAVTVGLIGTLFAGTLAAVTGIQRAFSESERASRLRVRSEQALARMVAIVSQGLTVDPQLAGIAPGSGSTFHGFRFQLIESFDLGTPVYDDDAIVFVHGPDAGNDPCAGVIIGRGESYEDLHGAAAGADDILGTNDDVTTGVVSGQPELELLLTSEHAPATGDMLSFEVIGRRVHIILRVNVLDSNGNFVFDEDLVLDEWVSLRQ